MFGKKSDAYGSLLVMFIKGLSMLGFLPRFFTNLSQKFLPDAYIFALILTFAAFLAGVFIQDKSPIQMVGYWGDGFWSLMQFSMQMALVLVSGFTLAKSNLVRRILGLIAGRVRNNVQAVACASAASCLFCYVNWGFGLVCSALLAVELAKKVKRVNYGLLIASSYSGFLVWHGGLSGSIPLKLTDSSSSVVGFLSGKTIGLESTIYSSLNLIILALTVFTLLCLNMLMAKDEANVREVTLDSSSEDGNVNTGESKGQSGPLSFSSKLENSRLLTVLVALMFLIYSARFFYHGGALNLNMVIFIFLGLAILLHWRPISFLNAFNNSVQASSGILLQFSFYAGIMGMISASGLGLSLSEFFISFADKDNFLLFSYLSAGLVNFFVPSGGGQWAVQGPIILPAAQSLGVDLGKAAMSIAWGDAWTNMVQPFWALPLLAAGRCALKDMMGYSCIIFIVIGIIQGGALLIFAHI